jgi:hypothetical protein
MGLICFSLLTANISLSSINQLKQSDMKLLLRNSSDTKLNRTPFHNFSFVGKVATFMPEDGDIEMLLFTYESTWRHNTEKRHHVSHREYLKYLLYVD